MKIFIKVLEMSKQRSIERDIDTYSRQQRNLVDYRIVEILGDMITKNKDIKILNNTMTLLQKIVDGPNAYCQSYLLDYLSNTEKSSILFTTLERLIMTSIDSIIDVVEQLSIYELNKVRCC